MLQLKKPLAFFDIEATGLNITSDRIIEICLYKIFPNGEEACKTYRVNPGMPIPAETSLIHGIYDEDVKDAPPFKAVAREIEQFIGNSDLSGYNLLKFDLPMLVEEFLRVDIDFDIENRKVLDVQKIFHMMEKRTLEAAYKFYCGKTLENAHSAESDTRATYEVLVAQLEKYSGLENNVEQIYNFTGAPCHSIVDFAGRMVKNNKGVEIFNFGKYKGTPVVEVFEKDPSYYSWMMNADFPNHTKKKLTEIRLRMKLA